MCVSQLSSSKTSPVRSCTALATDQPIRTGKEQVSVSFTKNDTASRVRLSFGSKPWVWSFLHHPQGAERIKYDPFPAHHSLQSGGKHSSPVAWIACSPLIPAELHWLVHHGRNEIAQVSSWPSPPLACLSLCTISPVPLSLGEVGNQGLACWVGTLHILVQLRYGWSSWAHTREMIQLQ